jgi:hypothetical protein
MKKSKSRGGEVKNDSKDKGVSEEFVEAFEVACEILRLEERIEEFESKEPQTITEIEIRDNQISSFKKRIEHLWMSCPAYQEEKIKPDVLIMELRAKGQPDHNIAWALCNQCNLSPYAIGKLLPANPGSNIAPESVTKQGRRLLKKYKDSTAI